MNKYPQLTEMGVTHPQQINKFLVNSISNFDVLRIVYGRGKGSLLPESRTYRFPRIQKTVQVDSGKSQTAVVMETNPALRLALDELQDLLKVNRQKQDVAESILQELQLLEEDIALRSSYIKDLAKRI